ncbi:hypothetical protein [Sorangium sp. So ce131]|uniref:hypothetical protein n=1 Tax=Sorangium sp. So ce131 TaxID=3133282 RepID=UPI003F646581
MERTTHAGIVRTALLLLAASLGACRGVPLGEGEGASGDAGDAISRATAACEDACEAYSEACGPENCSIACRVMTTDYKADVCTAEFEAYYACVAVQAPEQISCRGAGGFFGHPGPGCKSEWASFTQCRRTDGADCAVLARDTSFCTHSGDPPDWTTCKVGVEPPPGCVPLTSMDYCCPPSAPP